MQMFRIQEKLTRQIDKLPTLIPSLGLGGEAIKMVTVIIFLTLRVLRNTECTKENVNEWEDRMPETT